MEKSVRRVFYAQFWGVSGDKMAVYSLVELETEIAEAKAAIQRVRRAVSYGTGNVWVEDNRSGLLLTPQDAALSRAAAGIHQGSRTLICGRPGRRFRWVRWRSQVIGKSL